MTDLVFVDADVLAQATPRSLLYMVAAFGECGYTLTYSPHVEHEAERAQRSGATRVSVLRKRLAWDMTPDHPDPGSLGLSDTHWKDVPVMAAAVFAQADFIVTGNVRHFGEHDLAQHGMDAVHPGFFLAYRTTRVTYVAVVEALCRGRRRPPNTPLAVHVEEISVELPALFARYKDVFGPAESASTRQPPHLVFRGTLCVRCGRPLTDPASLATGIGSCCAGTEA